MFNTLILNTIWTERQRSLHSQLETSTSTFPSRPQKKNTCKYERERQQATNFTALRCVGGLTC